MVLFLVWADHHQDDFGLREPVDKIRENYWDTQGEWVTYFVESSPVFGFVVGDFSSAILILPMQIGDVVCFLIKEQL